MPKAIAAEKTSYDRIREWLTIPDEDRSRLPKADREIFNRWDFADNQLRRFPRKRQVVDVIMKKFGGSISRAYNDVYQAQRLFASVHPLNKEWIRNWLIEDILIAIELAKKAGDRKALASEHNNLLKAAALEKMEEQKVDPEILSQHNFYIVVQNGKTHYKYNLESFQSLPLSTRNKIVKELDQEITDVEAIEIMNS
jgi:hypothetical protein